MEREEREQKIQDTQREIDSLKASLSSSASDIGDWKINKIYEYRMMDKEDPYNFIDLCQKRQEVRDRINELQDLLKTL